MKDTALYKHVLEFAINNLDDGYGKLYSNIDSVHQEINLRELYEEVKKAVEKSLDSFTVRPKYVRPGHIGTIDLDDFIREEGVVYVVVDLYSTAFVKVFSRNIDAELFISQQDTGDFSILREVIE